MSLDAQYDPDNIFAKIIRREMPCTKVFEDDDILCFMDVFPQSEGHCLVVHKSSTATNLLTIDADALSRLTLTTQNIVRAVAKGLAPDGIRVAQFNGAPAGQTVFHLHFHVIPIYGGAPLGAHASGGPVGAEILEPVAARIRSAL
ncbi:MAG: HIT family protein [Pseudomonadota bacterium]